jgi:apolipoprotein N-acyltransferase
VVRSSELFEPAVFVEEIAQRDSTTVASRLGAWPEWVLTAIGGGGLLLAAAPRLIRRGRET